MIRERNVALCLILTIVTCGLYGIYWFICLTDELNYATMEDDTSGIMAVIFVFLTCGLYSLYWNYKAGEKVDKLKNMRGIPSTNTGLLYLILGLLSFGIITYLLIQDELNKNVTRIY